MRRCRLVDSITLELLCPPLLDLVHFIEIITECVSHAGAGQEVLAGCTGTDVWLQLEGLDRLS